MNRRKFCGAYVDILFSLKPFTINGFHFSALFRVLITLAAVVVFSAGLSAQSLHWVFFTEKNLATTSPADILDEAAIARRIAQGIPLITESDLPISQAYRVAVSEVGAEIAGESRWFNALVVAANPDVLASISAFPFVSHVRPVATYDSGLAGKSVDTSWPEIKEKNLALARMQTGRMQAESFTSRGFTGKGVRIAIFDAGFPNVDEHPAFAHLHRNNRIIATHNFVKDDSNVYAHHPHGAMVLSCIAGQYDSLWLGLAPDAEFLLARTELARLETKQEEHYWIMALEWADRMGAHIVSSSLGYTEVRYFRENLDGSSMLSRAAAMAVAKGILIVNAAGNERGNSWGSIVIPADSDSVLTVGGTNPYTDAAINFTSPGPTADGRLKPNVVAYGEVMAAGRKGYTRTFGTSFATPLVAGFAACLLQANPGMSTIDLMRAIERSGHLYPYFDYHHGYGIPQASRALAGALPEVAATFRIKVTEDYMNILVDTTYLPELDEEGFPVTQGKNLYYHIQSPGGRLRKYGVVQAEKEEALYFIKEELIDGDKIRVHFEGYTNTFTIDKGEQ